jgi:Domain of unknown function (DUF4386)
VAQLTIFSIGRSKTDSNTIWLGFADGTLQFTKNALTVNPPTWNLPPSQLAGPLRQGVATLAVDPTNTLEIVAVFPGIARVDVLTTPSRHVFLTSNAGATCLLVWRSGFIPRILGLFLFVACFGYLAFSFTGLLMPQYLNRVARIANIAILGEAPIILWLVIMGAKPEPLGTAGPRSRRD